MRHGKIYYKYVNDNNTLIVLTLLANSFNFCCCDGESKVLHTRDTFVGGFHVSDKIFAARLLRKQLGIGNANCTRPSARAPAIYVISDVGLAANSVVDSHAATNPHSSVAG